MVALMNILSLNIFKETHSTVWELCCFVIEVLCTKNNIYL